MFDSFNTNENILSNSKVTTGSATAGISTGDFTTTTGTPYVASDYYYYIRPNDENLYVKTEDDVKSDKKKITYKVLPSNNNFKIYGPELLDIKVIYDGEKPIGIKCYFDYDIVTMSMIQEEDVFDLDTGILICVAKALAQFLEGGKGNGNAYAYKYVKKAIKIMKEQVKAEKEKTELEQMRKRKREAKLRKIARRQQRRREEQIEIQTEAILKANEIQKRKDVGLVD